MEMYDSGELQQLLGMDAGAAKGQAIGAGAAASHGEPAPLAIENLL